MPKENKSSSRRSKRHCLEVNDEHSTPCILDSITVPLGSKRYSPFQRETPRRNSRGARDFRDLRESRDLVEAKDLRVANLEKEKMTMTHVEVTHPKSSSIIGSGIKYIMFPLHLLHLCIFGTSSPSNEAEKHTNLEERKEEKEVDKSDRKVDDKKQDRDERRRECRTPSRDRCDTPQAKSSPQFQGRKKLDFEDKEIKSSSSSSSKKSKPERDIVQIVDSDYEDSSDEMVTAPEDSDSSSDQWCSANNLMTMNMSVEYEHGLEKSVSFPQEEPMDVSMDEHIERPVTSSKILKEDRYSKIFKNDRRSISPRGSPDGQETTVFRSVDEEIATIFQKQCTSSDDESAVSQVDSSKSGKENKPLCRTDDRDSPTGSRAKKATCDNNNNNERKKKTSTEFDGNKRRKTTREDDASPRKCDRKGEEQIIDDKYRSREVTPSKRRSRSSRTPSKIKETKRKEVKYKEIATQTDSAFSDEDVEMTPVETKMSERLFSARSKSRLCTSYTQMEEMDQDLNYVADNEDSNDGSVNFVRQRNSSGSTTSSSSVDLGFDEQAYVTSEADFRLSRRKTDSPESSTPLRAVPVSRAPPGFPELPQHPPLTSSIYNTPNHITVQTSDCRQDAAILHTLTVPPAPTPMRHLYYNYPEFMDLPENVGTSKILWNILRNNYYR